MSSIEENMVSSYEYTDESKLAPETKPFEFPVGMELPAQLGHCVRSYKAMYETRSNELFEDAYPVWIGRLTRFLEEEAGVPTNMYSRTVKILVDMGCLYQIQRGSRRDLSRWALLHTPTMESWDGFRYKEGRTSRIRKASLEKRVQDLYRICFEQQRTIDALEQVVGKEKVKKVRKNSGPIEFGERDT